MFQSRSDYRRFVVESAYYGTNHQRYIGAGVQGGVMFKARRCMRCRLQQFMEMKMGWEDEIRILLVPLRFIDLWSGQEFHRLDLAHLRTAPPVGYHQPIQEAHHAEGRPAA